MVDGLVARLRGDGGRGRWVVWGRGDGGRGRRVRGGGEWDGRVARYVEGEGVKGGGGRWHCFCSGRRCQANSNPGGGREGGWHLLLAAQVRKMGEGDSGIGGMGGGLVKEECKHPTHVGGWRGSHQRMGWLCRWLKW